MPRPTRQDLAFIELVDRYLERVHRFLCNLSRDREQARELAHAREPLTVSWQMP